MAEIVKDRVVTALGGTWASLDDLLAGLDENQRNAALMPEPMRWRPLYPALGDVGAAAGAISLVQALAHLAPSSVVDPWDANASALAYASSNAGLVGGAIVTR